MTPAALKMRLDSATACGDFSSALEELMGVLSSSGPPTLHAAEVILKFMEQHGHLDFGQPGPLTHYVEQLYGHGYEAKLLESLRRRPTELTVWMLNRVLNGTREATERDGLIAALDGASRHPMASESTRIEAKSFLERLAEMNE